VRSVETMTLLQIEETLTEAGDAIALLLYAARTPMGVDPQAWYQANRALRALGREPVEIPDGYRDEWLKRVREVEA
jgi:hypothetical protein